MVSSNKLFEIPERDWSNMRHVSLPRKFWLSFNMLVFTDPVSDWELQWPYLASDWLSVIMWHNTVSSLVICNKTQPSDLLLPDWPQIVNNCTEQVSPQPSTLTDTTHWSLVLTAFGVMTMLSLFYTLIQSNTRSRSYMGGDWSTSLGLRATWKIS